MLGQSLLPQWRDPLSHQEIFERHYYLEILSGTWIAIAIAIMVFGVLVHINLNFIIGVCIIITAIVLLGVTLLGMMVWPGLVLDRSTRFVGARRILLIVKTALLVATMAFVIWAAVVMIERAAK